MSREVISDEIWAMIGPLFPKAAATGRPPVDRRLVIDNRETSAPDLPELLADAGLTEVASSSENPF